MRIYHSVFLFGLLLIGVPPHSDAQAQSDGTPRLSPVSWERLLDAADEPQNWLMHNGTLDSQRYSRLDQVNRSNVGDLELDWARDIRSSDSTETTPLVVDGVMFVTEGPSGVVALDAASGETLWRFERDLPVDFRACCGRNNRGIAILDEKLYMTTPDAHLIAIDARTGDLIWDVEVGAPTYGGYSKTTSPLVVKDRVLTGIAGGSLGARGIIRAYDVATGVAAWQTDTAMARATTPSEGQVITWSAGHAPAWTVGSYDPWQDLVYWGVGDPGDSHSVLAIDVDGGEVTWRFHPRSASASNADMRPDEHIRPPMLVDIEVDGERPRTVLWGDHHSLYRFNSKTGELLGDTPQPSAGAASWFPAFDPCSRRLYTGWDWTYTGQATERLVTPARLEGGASTPLLATSGGLVFGGGGHGQLKAWDQETGAVLWESERGSPVSDLWPVSFAVDGVQYVAAGNEDSVRTYAVPEHRRHVTVIDPAEKPVLQFDQFAGIMDDDPTPYVRIYRDGSVLVHYPSYMRSAGDYIRKLDCWDVENRLRPAVGDLYSIALEEIRSEVSKLEAEHWERTTSLTVGPDDPISVFVVNGEVQKRVEWKGLQRQAERLDHPNLDRLARIERWMFALADRDGLSRVGH